MIIENRAIVVSTPQPPAKLPERVPKEIVIRSRAMSTHDIVGHLTMAEIHRLIDAVAEISGERLSDRNTLLIKVIFDGCLRCSEALSLRPCDVINTSETYRVRILGKGAKPGEVAISQSIANEMQAYSYRHQLAQTDRLFPITTRRVHQLVSRSMELAGIRKPDRVGAVHVLRHTGAIERLRRTGNPRSVQHQLRHSNGAMTMRYLKTLESEASLQIQEEIDLWR